METITFLVANYNNSQYLGDCLNSVEQQTSDRWKCLVLDDKSTDDSFEILAARCNPGVRLLRNERNIGYTRSLIRLIDESDTDVVAILDADDALYPEATEAILESYAANPGIGFVYSNYRSYDETLTRPMGDGISKAIPPGRTALTDGWVGAIRTFRVSEYHKTSGLDPRLVYAEDRDLVYKMEEVTRLTFVDKILYKYRQTSGSQSRDPRKRKEGLRSSRRAYRDALKRRQIRGIQMYGHLLLVYKDHLRWGPYAPWVRRLARFLPNGRRFIANGYKELQ